MNRYDLTRIICAALLALVGLIGGVAITRATAPLQPIAACYAIAGGRVETTYVNVPASGAYPIASEGSIEQTETGFIARHAVTFESRVQRLYLPQVSK